MEREIPFDASAELERPSHAEGGGERETEHPQVDGGGMSDLLSPASWRDGETE